MTVAEGDGMNEEPMQAEYANLPHDEWYDDWTWQMLLGGETLHYSGGVATVAEGFDPKAIAEVEFWHVEEGSYGPEHNAAGVFRMEDGTYIVFDAWCDTTGWGCQADARFIAHPDRETALTLGIGDEERGWFGLAK